MPRRLRERLALGSLVLGVLGLLATPFIGWAAAAVAGLGLAAFAATGRAALRDASAHVPVPARGLRSAARVACDEAMLGLMQLRTDLPDDAELESVARELEHGLALATDPLERRPPPLERYALAPARLRDQPFLELRAESAWMPEAREPGWERWAARASNHWLRAAVLRHPGEPRPWLICVHGYRMGQPQLNLRLFDPLRLHRALGLNLLVPVLPLHGERRVGARSGDRFLDGRLVETRHALAQSVWELRRLVGWARAQGAPAVALYGVSLGALCAALVASVEPEIDRVLLGVPLADAAEVLLRHAPPDRIAAMERAGLSREKVVEWLAPVSALARVPKLAPERMHLYAAVGDRIVPPEQALRLQQRWGVARLDWLGGGHLTFFSDRRFRSIESEALAGLGG